jgi:hypothetical protein
MNAMHPPGQAEGPTAAEDLAITRYRLLLASAPPEQLERAHAEAFSRLSTAQREELLQRIAEQLPPADRALAGPANAQPIGIARLLTRLAGRHPGLLTRLFGASGVGGGSGGLVGTALLGATAGAVAAGAVVLGLGGFGESAAPADAAGAWRDTSAADGDLGGDGFDAGGFDLGGFDIA